MNEHDARRTDIYMRACDYAMQRYGSISEAYIMRKLAVKQKKAQSIIKIFIDSTKPPLQHNHRYQP